MAAGGPSAIALACKLVAEQLGDIPERVACHLLSKGTQTLPEVVRGTELPASQARQALLVLLQHNLVAAWLRPEQITVRGRTPPAVLYEPLLASMLQGLRKPKFLLHIREEMGEVGEVVLALLLEHGRLRVDQVLNGAVARLRTRGAAATASVEQGEGNGNGAAPNSDADLLQQVRSVFISMVHAHYVERAPPCTLPPPLLQPHPASLKRGARGAPRPGSEAMLKEQELAARRAELASLDKERFRLPRELMIGLDDLGLGLEDMDGDLEDGSGAKGLDGDKRAARRKGGPGGGADDDDDDDEVEARRPAKRLKAGGASTAPGARGAAGQGAGGAPAAMRPVPAPTPAAVTAPEGQSLWRVNGEEFHRRLRHAACVGLVRDKLGEDAGSVVAAMLHSSRQFETKVQEDQTRAMSEEEIATAVARLSLAGKVAPVTRDVPSIVRTVASDSLEMVSSMGTGPMGATFAVNSGRLIDVLRMNTAAAAVRDRFGQMGLRVFRLLLIRGQLEQKQISDLAMAPQKETRELLYRMQAAGYVMLQEIPRTADHAPSRCIYTWRVEYPRVTARVAADLYGCADRALLRLRHEMDKQREVLELIESSKAGGGGALSFSLTEAQRRAIERLKRVASALETTLMHLDDMVALFNDF